MAVGVEEKSEWKERRCRTCLRSDTFFPSEDETPDFGDLVHVWTPRFVGSWRCELTNGGPPRETGWPARPAVFPRGGDASDDRFSGRVAAWRPARVFAIFRTTGHGSAQHFRASHARTFWRPPGAARIHPGGGRSPRLCLAPIYVKIEFWVKVRTQYIKEIE